MHHRAKACKHRYQLHALTSRSRTSPELHLPWEIYSSNPNTKFEGKVPTIMATCSLCP